MARPVQRTLGQTCQTLNMSEIPPNGWPLSCSPAGYCLQHPDPKAKQLIKYIASHWVPKRMYLHLFYLWKFGRLASLKRPRTLNEKLQWKKLHGYRSLHTTVADKYAVREYIARKVGPQYLIPLIAIEDDVDDLDLSRLPNAFVIKVTHGSGQTAVIRDKTCLVEQDLKSRLRRWMRESHYYLSKEPEYKDIIPRLIVEELITDAHGNIPMDFKLHCFHGEIEAIQVDIDRFGNHRRNFYDVEWRLLPFTWSVWDGNRPKWPNGRAVERPASLEEMIGVAKTLAADFDYVRVDLYDCRGRVCFGELTLHHGGGWERFDPPRYDAFFGDKLDLSRNPE